MKKVVKLTALSLALALTSSMAAAAENIAFINAGYLFQNHPDREAIAKKLDSEFKGTADKLAANKKKIDAKIAALQKEAPKLRAADIKKREDEINGLVKAHEEQVGKFQAETQKVENDERAKLLGSIQTATNNIAKEKGYTYVIDANSVVYAVEGKDITEDVLKAISANKAPAAK
ncbi:periplasmic chaperone for outer membrane proteins Skp [Mesocricetibacter intestinalis]|uniref:Periplasmic chaperone for outer membrane proteins Skp n=1 Tax=Mesocricetibacter intestinalis TaxID=1521930 RepID=A0A4R6VBC2_9PAST|nr:OmpH family outer membrane protein [Mesocricetibacter intestinalis]TDQ59487.1 periplasmic chaperone for outer membrane proteins Skp [Mesocricetibacter intestinalis]